jgi:hypothetical protein
MRSIRPRLQQRTCPENETTEQSCARQYTLRRNYCIENLQQSYGALKTLWPTTPERIRQNCINHIGTRYDVLALCVEAGLAAQPPADAAPFHY